MIYFPHDLLPQGSTDWLKIRCGRPTASEFDKILTPAKGQKSSSQKAFAIRHVDERIHGGPKDVKPGYSNEAMEKGHAREPEAVERFVLDNPEFRVEPVGFVMTDDRRFGCSPDAFVFPADSGPGTPPAAGLEVKNYNAVDHFEWAELGAMPNDFKNQVHGCMIVTGLKTWYWGNNCPPYEAIFVRVDWNEYTDKLAAALDEYHREVYLPHLARVCQNRVLALDVAKFDAEIENMIRTLSRQGTP